MEKGKKMSMMNSAAFLLFTRNGVDCIAYEEVLYLLRSCNISSDKQGRLSVEWDGRGFCDGMQEGPDQSEVTALLDFVAKFTSLRHQGPPTTIQTDR